MGRGKVVVDRKPYHLDPGWSEFAYAAVAARAELDEDDSMLRTNRLTPSSILDSIGEAGWVGRGAM